MSTNGSDTSLPNPYWLLAELTYKCPLQCPYCSNPLDIARHDSELSTDEWKRVFREARKMGAVQLGFSGGEPLVREDLEELISEAHTLGFYTNLITSGVGMDEDRIRAFKAVGLDHIQISFQASNEEINNHIARNNSFRHKQDMARLVKKYDYPMVLCFVLHRQNTDQTEEIIQFAHSLDADYLELATTQYYGWALKNREQLLPTLDQVQRAEAIAHEYQEKLKGKMRILYVVPDYYEDRPKPCMRGWGGIFLAVSPNGTALPCHAAGVLPGLTFPNVRDHSIDWIWKESPDFNLFRGELDERALSQLSRKSQRLRWVPLSGLPDDRRCGQRRPGVQQVAPPRRTATAGHRDPCLPRRCHGSANRVSQHAQFETDHRGRFVKSGVPGGRTIPKAVNFAPAEIIAADQSRPDPHQALFGRCNAGQLPEPIRLADQCVDHCRFDRRVPRILDQDQTRPRDSLIERRGSRAGADEVAPPMDDADRYGW